MTRENVSCSPTTRASSSPPSIPTRRKNASSDSPRSGALVPTAATSTGWGAPKRPSSSRVQRKRAFGDGGLGRMRRRLLTQIGSQNIFRLRSFAVLCGRKRLIARGAQSRSRHQKPARASRAGHAGAAQVDAGQAPADHKAHLLETRRLVKSEESPPGAASGAPTVHRPAPAEPRAPRGPWRRIERAWPGSRSRVSPGEIGSRAAPCPSATLLARPLVRKPRPLVRATAA